MTSQLAKDTESVVYSGIGFQGRAGSLVLTAEKLLFRQDTPDDGSSVWTRSWLWASIKKSQVIRSSAKEGTPVKRAVKICNYSNKAVVFQVPESVVIEKLQKDMNARMVAAAKELKKTPVKTRANITDDAVQRALELSQTYKVANGNAQDNASLATVETVTTTVVTTVTTMSESSSRSLELVNTAPRNTTVAFENPSPRSKKPATSAEPKRARSNSAREASAKPSATARGAPMRSSDPGRAPKKVSLIHATKVITQDLFVKPSQQMAHDLVVRPTNNLIVKPVRQNIIDPAQEKIIKPVQKKLSGNKSAQEKLVDPPKEDNPSNKEDQAALELPQAETTGESETTTDTMDMSSSSSRRASNKKPFLYFLKAPPRRTFSQDQSTENCTVPSDEEQPKVPEEDDKPVSSRKSTGSKLFSSMKGFRRSRSSDEHVVPPSMNMMARSAA